MAENQEVLEEVRQIVGEELFEALSCRFGGSRIYFPRTGYMANRNDLIRREYDMLLASKIESVTAIEFCSRKFNLSPSWIRKIVSRSA